MLKDIFFSFLQSLNKLPASWRLMFFALQNRFVRAFLACRVYVLKPGCSAQHFHAYILFSTGSSTGWDQSSGGPCVVHSGGSWRFEGSIICQVWKQHQSRGRWELRPQTCGLDLTDCQSPTGNGISTLTSSRPVYSGDVCCISHVVMFSELFELLDTGGFVAAWIKTPARENDRHWCKNKTAKYLYCFHLFLVFLFICIIIIIGAIM